MARKRSLIVDDSKSARVLLGRLLEKYDIEVEMAQSAEEAIEFLKSNRYDAIFMDHRMPGMDGLQAVRAIKGNPKTATIPIMMYTSQEGELYVGQARALGAMGVLPKQVRPVDVSKVLHELHLLPDRGDATTAGSPVDLASAKAGWRPPDRTAGAAAAADWAHRVESAVQDQGVELRRFIVDSLDGVAGRIVGDLRDTLTLEPRIIDSQPARPPAPKPAWPWAAVLGATGLAAAFFAVLWSLARNELGSSRAEVARLSAVNAELIRAREDLAAAVQELGNTLAAAPGGRAAPSAPMAAAASAGAAPIARTEPVPYGEIPLDRSRLDVLRDLIEKLEAQGFHGVVKIATSAGSFCLSGNATDGYVPANVNLPVGKCDLIGNPFEESSSGQLRESVAFANLVAVVRQRTAGAIAVAIETNGGSRVAAPYPVRSESLTAGEWNRAAAGNNRVDFTVEQSLSP